MTARLQTLLMLILLLALFAGAPAEHCEAACAVPHCHAPCCKEEAGMRTYRENSSPHQHRCSHFVADETHSARGQENMGMPPHDKPTALPPFCSYAAPCALQAKILPARSGIRLPMLC